MPNPAWEWLAGSKWFCGSICTTLSPHPMVYVCGTSGTHTIILHVGASGRDPVVAKYHINGELPAHLLSGFSLEGGEGIPSLVKERKGHCRIGRLLLGHVFTRSWWVGLAPRWTGKCTR